MKMGAKIRYRKDRGWFVRVYSGGKQFEEKCSSEAEARATAAAINARTEASGSWLRGGPLPIKRCLDGWLETHGPELARSTEANSKSLIENHLGPYFGTMDLRALTREDVIDFANRKLESGLAPRTVETALSILRRVCALHREAGLIDDNPALGSGRVVARVSRRFEHTPRDIDAWTREEVRFLLQVSQKREPFIYAPFMCAIHTGMRRGEILGLRWEDIGAKKMRVRRSLVRGHITTTKSGKSREVPISQPLREILDELRKDLSPWEEPGHVFLSPKGMRWDERNFARAFDRLRTKAHKAEKVRPLHFHCARHTFASWALEAGRSIKWVQATLGHASAEITLRTYSHLMPSTEDEMDFLSNPEPDQTGPNGTPNEERPRRKWAEAFIFKWSTRPDSNWRLAYGQYSSLANRSRLPLPLAMLLIERVQSQNQPKAPGTKKPAPLRGTGSFVWSTRPGSNWRPSRWQRA